MVYQETVVIFSAFWWSSVTLAFIYIFLLLLLPFHVSWAKTKNYSKFIGAFILFNILAENAYGIYLGVWNVKHFLPLHFCGISGLLASIAMFRFSNKIATVLFYWGTIGGFYAIVTPEFDFGTHGYFFYGYIIEHASIILVPLYAVIHLGFEPPKNSWLRIFFFSQIAAVLVGLVNWQLDSNYMYLSSPPIAQNPFILGKWPWYLIIIEIIALVHFFFLCSSFGKIKVILNSLKKVD